MYCFSCHFLCQYQKFLLLLLLLCCFYYYGSVVEFEVQYCDTSSIAFIVQNIVAIQDLLFFHLNFKVDFSVSMKNVIGILIDITLNIQLCLLV
jgi:hypothetical protein